MDINDLSCDLPLIPRPRRLERHAGAAFDAAEGCRVHPDHATHRALADLVAATGLRITPDSAVPRCCLLGGRAVPDCDPGTHPQGYGLVIASDGLALRASTVAGLRHGIHCLRQIHAVAESWPPVAIADAPAVALRAHHDDISRGQVSTVDDFKDLIATLASYRFNAYTWYLEDTLHLPSFGDIGEGRGKLMPAEVRELVAYAADYGIELYPTMSLIGHQHNLLALPAYRRFGAEVFQPASAFDPKAEGLYPFLEQVIDDICELFPAPWFHMCFDEVIGLDEDEFIAHVNWCAERLVERGKTPVMWIDMFQNHYGMAALERIHPAVVPCPWIYSAEAVRGKRGEAIGQCFAQRTTWGLAAYATTCQLVGALEHTATCAEAWVEALAGRDDTALCCSIWGDMGYENQRQAQWHHYAQFAEVAWCGERVAEFPQRFVHQHFGLEDADLAAVLGGLEDFQSTSLSRLWSLFHSTHSALVRLARREPELVTWAASVEPRLEALGRRLADLAATAPRRGGEIELRQHELDRARLVLHRLVVAAEYGASPPATVVDALRQRLGVMRRVYRELWLRHNRPQNLSISDACYAMLVDDLDGCRSEDEPTDCRCLELPSTHAVAEHDLDGVPIGLHTVPGATTSFPMAGIPFSVGRRRATPFRFADADHSHHLLPPGGSIALDFACDRIMDCHLVASTPKGDGEPRDCLRFHLMRDGVPVYREVLQSVRHVVDWWAAAGTHMWAGGGLAHADPQRVRPVVDILRYTISAISRFPFVGEIDCDGVELVNVGEADVQLFALTLVRAPEFAAS